MTGITINDCSSAGDNSGDVVLQIWGIDKKGQPINSLLTCATERIARHAASAALGELGTRVHFLIKSMKDED